VPYPRLVPIQFILVVWIIGVVDLSGDVISDLRVIELISLDVELSFSYLFYG